MIMHTRERERERVNISRNCKACNGERGQKDISSNAKDIARNCMQERKRKDMPRKKECMYEREREPGEIMGGKVNQRRHIIAKQFA